MSVWIFINLVFLGMCGYIYLLWSQYWQYVERQQEHMAGLMNNARSGGGGVSQIFYYNHDTSTSTTDPDAIVISSGNRRNDLSKHHSNDKPGNRTYVGRKYVITESSKRARNKQNSKKIGLGACSTLFIQVIRSVRKIIESCLRSSLSRNIPPSGM